MRKSTLVLNCTSDRVITCFDNSLFFNLLPTSTPSMGVFTNEKPFRLNREIYFRKGFFDFRVADKRRKEIAKIMEKHRRPSIDKLRLKLIGIFN